MAYQHVVVAEGSVDEVISPRETSRYPLSTLRTMVISRHSFLFELEDLRLAVAPIICCGVQP